VWGWSSSAGTAARMPPKPCDAKPLSLTVPTPP
jgi:hypothetical protein